ncbi:MAG: carboxylesterase family protein, partial [Nonomuraea sp.]|nr:carboxylesterase family protein [Nonomuraea sp.]
MHSITYATAGRFAAPEPANVPFDGPGPAAPQRASRLERVMGPAADVGMSEDCLTLNVWSPGGEGLPVLVFLHGGGFLSGSAGLPWYDGRLLAERGGIVVVTASYRLGALGYLYVSDEFGPANLGLLDQTLALRWVRDHIAGYGGDPANVTLAGQSAG